MCLHGVAVNRVVSTQPSRVLIVSGAVLYLRSEVLALLVVGWSPNTEPEDQGVVTKESILKLRGSRGGQGQRAARYRVHQTTHQL